MSTNLIVLINVVIMLAIIYGLGFLKKQNISFTTRVFIGMGIGIVFGAILQIVFGADSDVVTQSNSWFAVVGSGYVRLLMMVVIPLVFLSITSAIITQDSKNLGKMAVRIIAVLLITTAIAAFVGAITTSVFNLTADGLQTGEAESSRGDALESTLENFQSKTVQEQIMEIVPTNPFFAMTGQGSNATLSVVAFAVLLSLAAIGIKKTKPESAEFFIQMIKSLQDVVMRLVTMILRLTPYGVLALMTRMVSSSNFKEILRLINFVIANYVALAIVFVIHLIILAVFGLSPAQFLKKGLGTLMFAFSSRSSAGTLPLTIETQTEQFGVAPGFANLAGTLGTSIGQNGWAGVYPAMLAVMIAPTLGINPLAPAFLIKLVLVATFASFGIAGVGGGATFAALIVLSAMGLPVGLAGLLIAIEPLIDMGRTLVNVSDSMLAGVVSAKMMGEIDMDVYNSAPKVEN